MTHYPCRLSLLNDVRVALGMSTKQTIFLPSFSVSRGVSLHKSDKTRFRCCLFPFSVHVVIKKKKNWKGGNKTTCRPSSTRQKLCMWLSSDNEVLVKVHCVVYHFLLFCLLSLPWSASSSCAFISYLWLMSRESMALRAVRRVWFFFFFHKELLWCVL